MKLKEKNTTLWYRTRLAKTQKRKSQTTNTLDHSAVDISDSYNLFSLSEPDKWIA